MDFQDKITAKKWRMTDDGYLVTDAPVARTGIQLYRGSEVGRPEKSFVRVYRPEEEVFDEASLHSYAHRPMTNDHPGDLVTAENWKDFAIGQTGDEVVRDGQTVRVPLVMMDAAAIAEFENGKRELSMGYTADVEFLDEEQETEDGMKYDAIQRNLRMNHLALVTKGRAGNAKIGDRHDPENVPKLEGGRTMAENLKKVLVDGLEIETTTQGAQVIEKLTKQLLDAETAAKVTSAATEETIEAKDKELAVKDAEIEKLQKQIDSIDVDSLVDDRADLLATAKSLHDGDYKGLSSDEVKKAVVVGVLGDEAVVEKTQAYIDARFDILSEEAKFKPVDAVRQGLVSDNANVPNKTVTADQAYQAYENHLQEAWRQ